MPLAYVAFDVMALGEELLVDEPLSRGASGCALVLTPRPSLALAPFEPVGDEARGRSSTRASPRLARAATKA